MRVTLVFFVDGVVLSFLSVISRTYPAGLMSRLEKATRSRQWRGVAEQGGQGCLETPHYGESERFGGAGQGGPAARRSI